MKIEIKCKYTDNVLFDYNCKDNTIKKTVENAVNESVNLQGADLRGVNLQGADLQGAYLQGAYLRSAYLRGAYLRSADLRGAYLQDLKSVSISDHYLLSQILFNNANTIKQRAWAGLIRINLDWCWKDFLENMSKPCIKWCLSILGKYPEFKEMYEKEAKS